MATIDEVETSDATRASAESFDVEAVRADFPALELEVYDKPLVYLDNAATTQKPASVLAAEDLWYRESCANVHRGVHFLSQKATDAYEEARAKVQRFINAEFEDEIVFVRGTTDAINLVASSYGRKEIGSGDEILISHMEHHSNIVPWQLLCEEKGAVLKVAPINDRGEIIMEELEALLTARTRMVAVGYVSNALGTINPVKQIVDLAHERGVAVLVDGAQAMPHLKVDVRDLGCDFFAFSGHKMFAPTGIGGLYGRREILQSMPPYQGGGEMILTVSFERSDYADPPARFEAGTPNIAGAVALGAAVDYLSNLGMDAIGYYESGVLDYATELVDQIPGVRIIGTAAKKASVLSFVLEGVHAHDVGTILDREGIAVRAGHHCAQPVMKRYGVPATTRASFALYNTRSEAERLAAAITRVREVFG
jgi:cysteine desulfurase/selenocysteine lyase